MKKLIAALCLVLFFAPFAAFAKDARVARAEAWLQNLTTAQARFEQRGYDGTVLSGNFYISRPGRLRFEYDRPMRDFVVADGTFLYFYDGQQKQASSAPIGTTLADFLLRRNVRLDGDLKVKSIRTLSGTVSITVVQSADPDAGQLELRFTEEPFQLKSWRITDAQGLASEIILSNFKAGVAVAPSLFVFKDPSGKGGLNN